MLFFKLFSYYNIQTVKHTNTHTPFLSNISRQINIVSLP